jgi:hypothetical protein
MIRKILILILVSILLAGCLTGEPAEQGTLDLTSSPSGAEIYLDSQYKGTTPSTIAGLIPGSHTLELRLKGYKSWKGAVTVPAGTSDYRVALTALAGFEETPEITLTPGAPEPVSVTVQTSRAQMIVGDSITFSGKATGTDRITLTVAGPGYYANGIVLDKVRPDADDAWMYRWNPGTKIQSGTYTIIADAGTGVSARETFTAIGNGVVSVSPSSYAVPKGETVVLSGRCSTGAPEVKIVMFGPERYASGVDLGTLSVMGDQTWSFRYKTDLTMPTGIYTVYVKDVPETTTGSTQFTIGFAS